PGGRRPTLAHRGRPDTRRRPRTVPAVSPALRLKTAVWMQTAVSGAPKTAFCIQTAVRRVAGSDSNHWAEAQADALTAQLAAKPQQRHRCRGCYQAERPSGGDHEEVAE